MTDNQNKQRTPDKVADNVQYIAISPDMFNAQNTQDNEIDLRELWHVIWSGKWIIIGVTTIFVIALIIYAFSLPNIYKAKAILAPASSESSVSGLDALAGQFGGLASMAGLNLGGSTMDKTALALEIIQSRSFVERFIAKHQLLIPLMASDNWDVSTNTLVLDEELYNTKTKQWIRAVSAPKTPKPSPWEAYKEFVELLSVSQDKTTSLVTLEIEHYSPTIAKQWLIWLIEDINNYVRDQDEKEAQASIEYLLVQLQKTQVNNMEAVFYELIEEQTKNMMLTQVKAEYVLKTIDPSQVPDEKASPKRALIVILGAILGFVLSLLIVLIRYFVVKPETMN